MNDLIGFCEEDVTKPSEQCDKLFSEALEKCAQAVSPILEWICLPVKLTKLIICTKMKLFDKICLIPNFIKEKMYVPLKRVIKNLYKKTKNYFKLKIQIKEKLVHKIIPQKNLK